MTALRGVSTIPAMVVLCDFDDTAAVQNVALLLIDRFLPSEGKELRERIRNKEITLKEYQERAFSLMREDRDTFKRYVREHATLREGFVELVRYCRDHDVTLAIVTLGLDFYVEAVLEKYGLEDVTHYAVQSRFNGGVISYAYPFTRPECEMWGMCKCGILEMYRAQGHEIIYVGDAMSDTCPASKADLVFARARLLSYCQEKGIPHRELTSFHDVIAELEHRQKSPI